jgi:alpha-beta hydrolase superfamily lysophospholipase
VIRVKRTHWFVIVTALVAIAAITALEYVGYQRIPVEGGTLYGKTMGRNKDLVVLLVAGSGPTDMDGNTPVLQGKNNSLLYLATGLSREGISTFRYDKRTAGRSAETFDNTANMDFDRFVDDCAAVVRHLRKSGYKQIVIMGHSKGSLVGMLTAAREPVDGFISIGGTGHTIDITLERQLLNFFPKDSKEIQMIHSLRDGKVYQPLADDPQYSIETQEFLLSWMKHNPAQILKDLTIPALIVQGEADLQADMSDFAALLPGNNKTHSAVLPHMNHVLKHVESEHENKASYNEPAYALHADLIPAMVSFVRNAVGR